MPLSNEERNEFRISISSKPLPKLTKLFNQLTKDENNDHLSDDMRDKAHEKAAMARREIEVRKCGGSSG